MWQGWMTFGVGLWLIASGIRVDFQAPINLMVCGILAIIFGFSAFKNWMQFAVGFLGIFAVIMALAINPSFDFSVIYYVIGGLITVLSLMNAPQKEWKHLLE